MNHATNTASPAERDAFEAAMNARRFLPRELDFARTISPSGRVEYANSHLESCWVGWQARATQASAEPVAWAVVAAGKIEHVSTSKESAEGWLPYVADRTLVPLCFAAPSSAPSTEPIPAHRMALNVRHPNSHKAADAFWTYWKENGETHKHGYYESTWGAINRAIRMVGVVEHDYFPGPDKFPERAPSIDSAGEAIARGYESSTMTSDPTGLGATIKLHYESAAEAEAAFDAITDLIAAMQPQGAGGQND